jgi:hypothetical protein
MEAYLSKTGDLTNAGRKLKIRPERGVGKYIGSILVA